MSAHVRVREGGDGGDTTIIWGRRIESDDEGTTNTLHIQRTGVGGVGAEEGLGVGFKDRKTPRGTNNVWNTAYAP